MTSRANATNASEAAGRSLHVARLAAMVRVHQELVEAETAQETLEARIVEITQDVLGGNGVALALLEGDALVYRAARGPLAGRLGRRKVMDEGFAGEALRLGRAVIVPNLRQGLAAPADIAIGSLIVAPIRFRQTDLGVIEVVATAPGTFSDADREIVELLAAFVGSALRRHEYERQLHRSERQYRMLFDHNPHPMWVFDVQTLRFLAVNLAAIEQYGYSREEFLGMTLRDIRPESEQSALEQAVSQLSDEQPRRGLRRHRRKNGEPIDVEVTSDPIEFAGRRARLVLAHDVTLRLRAEEGQARANRALRLLTACNAAMIRIAEETPLLQEICRIVVEIGGYRLARVGYARNDEAKTIDLVASAGASVEKAWLTRLSWDADDPLGQGPAGQTVRSGRMVIEPDLQASAQPFPWREVGFGLGLRSAIALPLCNDAGCFGFLGLYSEQVQDPQGPEIGLLRELSENVSFGIGALRAERERLAVESRLAFQAAHDATTGLPRYAVQEPQIAAMLARPQAMTAVLVVDIDRFKAVNESLGHLTGDHVLRRVAERVARFAGPQVLVSHFAADELLVAAAVDSEEEALALAERLRAAIAEPIEADGYRLVLGATIGVSHGPAHGGTPQELTRTAQAAMERGKELGRDQAVVFRLEQLREIEDRVTLGARLRNAAERGELCLNFQPQFRAADHRVTGFEALLRWASPELGMVSPARFIPLAEALGLMPEIGAWVIRDACRQVRAWLDQGHEGFVVAVNVSAQQLQRPGLLETVTAALAEHRVPPAMLDIELTESSLMENVGRVKETLAELKRLGIMLSLDDFGTGYSSLAYLKTFSLDKLKIDQSFVRGLPGNRNDAAIAGMIVSIGHQLDLVVAAEGVETAEQAELLRGIGCDELQGYHFGRPVLPEAAATHFTGAASARER